MTIEDAKKARKQILFAGIVVLIGSVVMFLISDSMEEDFAAFMVMFFGAVTIGWAL